MGAQETELQQPNDNPQETARAAQALLVEAGNVLEVLKGKVAEVDAKIAGFADLTAAAQAKVAEINETATAAVAVKTQVTDTQAVIAAKSEHIQGAQEHADKVRAELDRIQTAATQSATEAEGLRGRAQSANDSVAETLTAVRGHKAKVEADLAVTGAARDQAKAASEAAKTLADKSATIEERVAGYEKRLAELEEQSKRQLETIISLLPGATATGLASAFDGRRKTFLSPATRWQGIFVFSVLLLILLAVTGFWNVYTSGKPPEWDELFRLWAARLPIAAALIWLALHASHESALAKRLEEDYGFKAATAASFQGFQRQMAEIGASAAVESPLAKLCKETLEIIGSPPGRIYDKHHLTARPAQEMAGLIKELGSSVKELAENLKKGK